MTTEEAIEKAGKGYRLIGVCDLTRQIGFEVYDVSDKLVARFNMQNEEVFHLLADGDDIPLPPRIARRIK